MELKIDLVAELATSHSLRGMLASKITSKINKITLTNIPSQLTINLLNELLTINKWLEYKYERPIRISFQNV